MPSPETSLSIAPASLQLKNEIQQALAHAASYDTEKAATLNQPIQFYPGTFDQLKAAALLYQRFQAHTPRTRDMQDFYKETMDKRRANPQYDQATDIKKRIMNEQPIALAENDFPPDLPCDHYTLWYDQDITVEQLAKFLADEFEKRHIGPQGRRYILKESPRVIKSVPEINHLHIFAERENPHPSDIPSIPLTFDFPLPK